MAQMSSVLWDPGSSAHQCGLTLHELTNLTSISLSLSVYTELVGGLEHGFYFPFSWECHHPNSRPLHHIFQRGWRKTTNQIYIYILLYIIILLYYIILYYSIVDYNISTTNQRNVFLKYLKSETIWGTDAWFDFDAAQMGHHVGT